MSRDGLKPLKELLEPGFRNTCFAMVNYETGEQTELTLETHYARIEQYGLHGSVPESVATKYDTARNIYAYAWFEYRFYNVAETNVLIALEFALKERVGEPALKTYIKQRKAEHLAKTEKRLNLSKGMKTLMEYSRDHQLVKNEGFSAWHSYATRQAYYKAKNEQHDWAAAEMQRTGKDEIELPDIPIVELPPDPDYDHVQHLIDHVKKFRNNYAHGSAMLHPNVLNSFEMVSEYINQLFSESEQVK